MAALSVPKILKVSVEGTAFHFEAQEDTDPGVAVQLFQLTVPALTKRVLFSLQVICRQQSFWELDLDGTLIASGRTGVAHPVDNFPWFPGKETFATNILTLNLRYAERMNSQYGLVVQIYQHEHARYMALQCTPS